MEKTNMEMSEKTADLFTAFALFQGDLTNASKSKAGHGYKYADLAQCIETAREPLLKQNLAVAQFIGQSDKGTTLTTMLTHSSGQWMRDEFLMEKAVLQGGAGKNPAQAMGASITYMRRYAYTAIIGMTQEDEDACNVKIQAKATKQLAPEIDLINEAIKNNDVSFVQENWQGSIAKVWASLNGQQIESLNNLIKG
jgi:hypothetical protein